MKTPPTREDVVRSVLELARRDGCDCRVEVQAERHGNDLVIQLTHEPSCSHWSMSLLTTPRAKA